MERKDLAAALHLLEGVPTAWTESRLAHVDQAYPAVVIWHHPSGVAITATVLGNAVNDMRAVPCTAAEYQRALGVIRGGCPA